MILRDAAFGKGIKMEEDGITDTSVYPWEDLSAVSVRSKVCIAVAPICPGVSSSISSICHEERIAQTAISQKTTKKRSEADLYTIDEYGKNNEEGWKLPECPSLEKIQHDLGMLQNTSGLTP
jgi:hypothetical protein